MNVIEILHYSSAVCSEIVPVPFVYDFTTERHLYICKVEKQRATCELKNYKLVILKL